jgi:hypothetical protein
MLLSLKLCFISVMYIYVDIIFWQASDDNNFLYSQVSHNPLLTVIPQSLAHSYHTILGECSQMFVHVTCPYIAIHVLLVIALPALLTPLSEILRHWNLGTDRGPGLIPACSLQLLILSIRSLLQE